MKKYRLVKIRIKTREVISVSENAEKTVHPSVCPVCHSPLAVALPAAENHPAEILPADLANEKNNR